jgi:hypothetical protein
MGLECEIGTKKSIRQTVISAESLTRKSLLSAFHVLRTCSLAVAQLFPSAYFKERNPRIVHAVRGFFYPRTTVNIFGCSPLVKLKLK